MVQELSCADVWSLEFAGVARVDFFAEFKSGLAAR